MPLRPEPAISVVIPTFDRAAVLGRCLHSVLEQTFRPLEVVVVDDGSEDETERVVRELGSELVRYVRLPSRSGAQAARNRGIREARGDWIAFQDSDDEWLPDKLERQVALLAERSLDPWTVVHGDPLVPEPSGALVPWQLPRLDENDPLAVLLRRPATMLQAILVSRAAFDKIGGLDEQAPSFHEWDTSIRLAHHCRFVAPPDPVFVYDRNRQDSVSSSKVAHVRGYRYVAEKFREEIVGRCGEDAWQAHVLRQLRLSLEFGLWEEAGRLLPLVQPRGARYRAYALCRRLRLRPSYVGRLRRVLVRRERRRQSATAI